MEKLYTYAYKLRGFSLGCQPTGFVSHNDNLDKLGTVTYNKELTDNQINDYELVPYNDNKIELNNNDIYYVNDTNYTDNQNEYIETYQELLDYKNDDSDILDSDILDELYDNKYSFWIKIINNNPYYNNGKILCNLNLLYINKPISFYIDKNKLINLCQS